MTIQSRLPKINTVAQQATLVYTSDKSYSHKLGKSYTKPVRTYHVDSLRDDKPYQVRWELTKEDGIITFKTGLWSFEAKYHNWQHPANHSQYICYQVLGAIKAAAIAQGKTISFCDSFDKAVKLTNFGGQLVKITNKGNELVWGVVR